MQSTPVAETTLDRLYFQWAALGGRVFLGRAPEGGSVPMRSPSDVIVETTVAGRDDPRLLWIALDWMIRNPAKLDVEDLVSRTGAFGNVAVLGLLCDAAKARNTDPVFDRIVAKYTPNSAPEALFPCVADSAWYTEAIRTRPHPLCAKWGFQEMEIEYLGDPKAARIRASVRLHKEVDREMFKTARNRFGRP